MSSPALVPPPRSQPPIVFTSKPAVANATLARTRLLDYDHERIRAIVEALPPVATARERLQAAHGIIREQVRPVYTVDELQPASVTVLKGKGSCSQRMAVLEAVARSISVPTRVRALWVSGEFWYPRFQYTRTFIPRLILLAWPQFKVDGSWIDFDELYGSANDLAARGNGRFTNSDETIFEAVARTSVDLLGKSVRPGAMPDTASRATSAKGSFRAGVERMFSLPPKATGAVERCESGVCPSTPAVDLSKFVRRDDGFFDSRDELFATFRSFQHSLRGAAFELLYGGKKSA